MKSYNSYHSHLKILAVNNLLPSNFKHIIPQSTVSSWKQKSDRINNPIGMNSFVSEEDFMKIIETMSKKALFYKTCKAILKLFNTVTIILNSIENKQKVLKQNKKSIVDCIEFLKADIGINRACKIFNITSIQLLEKFAFGMLEFAFKAL